MEFKFEVGEKVKDTITGFQGVIVAKTKWLNGCIRYVVQSRKRTSEGKTVEDTIDEQQLVSLEPAKKKKTSGPGGARTAPKNMAAPTRPTIR
jgi:hypothetical protein